MIDILATVKDQASAGLSALSQNILGVGAAGGTAEAGLAGLQNIIGGGLVAGARLAIGAITGIGVAAFDVAGDVQSAAGDIQSELGITAEEAQRTADIAGAVWGNNFAGDIGEAADALIDVRQILGDLNDQELQTSTENAFRLADTFGTDVTENIAAAGVLMDEFGLTSDQAFDFITTGFQRGLNKSDDFLDSIGEYGNLFGDAGFGAEEFFNIMETGAAGGVLGTDKISDAVKEFGIIFQAGGDDVAKAYDSMGIDYQAWVESVGRGDATVSEMFERVVSKLQEIEDPIERNRLQVALFGTAAEDLGASFADGLSVAGVALDDMAGSTAALDVRYNSLGEATEGYKRKALLALEPIGAILLNLANQIMPLVDGAFAFFETNIVPALETAAGVVEGFFNNLSEGMTPLDAFIEAIWLIAPPEVLAFLISLRDEILPQLAEWFTANVQPILDMVAGFVGWQDILIVLAGVILSVVIPAVVSMIIAMAPILLAIVAIIAVIALLRNAWEQNWGGIQEKTAAVIAFIQNLIVTVLTAIQSFWAAHGDQILAKASEIWTAIQLFITTAITTIQEIITVAALAIQEFWAQHGEAIKATATEFWTVIQEFIGGVWAAIQTLFGAFKAAFEGDWETFGANIRQTWETYWTAVVEFLGGLWEMIQPKLAAAWESIKAWWAGIDWAGLGTNVLDGIVGGLSAGAGRIAEALQAIADAAWASWQGFWDSSSPSKLMTNMVRDDIIGAAADTIDQTAPKLAGAMGGAAKTMYGGFDPSQGGGVAALMDYLAPTQPIRPLPTAAALPTTRPPVGLIDGQSGGGSGGASQIRDIHIQITIQAPGGYTILDEKRIKAMVKDTTKQAVNEAIRASGQRADIIRRSR